MTLFMLSTAKHKQSVYFSVEKSIFKNFVHVLLSIRHPYLQDGLKIRLMPLYKIELHTS